MGGCLRKVFCCGGCCKKSVDADAYESQLPKFPPTPNHGRKCRDVLGILLFVAFWVGMIIVASVAVGSGNPWRLLYGTDYKGNVCGSDRSEKLTAYPRLTEDLLVAAEKLGSVDAIANNLDSIDFFGVCVDTCPDLDEYVCTYEAEAMVTSSTAEGRRAEIDACKDAGYTASRFSSKCTALYDECWYQGLKTFGYLFRCIPLKEETTKEVEACLNPANVPADSQRCRVKQVNSTTSTRTTGQENGIYDQMTSSVYMWAQYFGDLMTTWYVVLVAGVLGCTALSFLFIYLLKFFAGCIVWGILLLTVLLTGALALLFYIQAGVISSEAVSSVSSSAGASFSLPEEADTNQTLYKGLAYVFTGVFVLEIIFLVAARKAIRLGIGVLRTAGKALRDIPSLIVCPVVSAVFVTALAMYYIFVAATLYSMGDSAVVNFTSPLDRNSSSALTDVATFDFSTQGRYLQLYHFFGLLWTNQFLAGITITTLAGAVCRWYWVPRDDHNSMMEGAEMASARCGCGKCVCSSPLWAAFKTTMRYHLGSIAIGSFLIAVVQFVRAVLAYIQQQMKDKVAENRLLKMLFCVIQSYLKCFEKCLKFISRLAYIQIALFGTSFFSSAATVVSLVISNAMRISVLNYVSFFLILLGKVVATIATAIVAFLWLSYNPEFQTGGENELASIWLPLFITTITAYAVSSNIFYVYDVTIDTIFVCFLHDERIANNFRKAPFNRYLGKQIGIPAPKESSEEKGDESGATAESSKVVDVL